MKIGIITFHWATNYGAILQTFALQTILLRMGYDVKIINYKPSQYDNKLWSFFRFRKFLHPYKYYESIQKENKMVLFRSKYLLTTNRYFSINELRTKCNEFDILISGSDQVLNPSFLEFGEGRKSTAYFLDFGRKETVRIFYAVSFGTTNYPSHLVEIVKPFIQQLNSISVREESGIDILNNMGRNDVTVVPDPTLLLYKHDYKEKFGLQNIRKDKIFVFMLHNKLSRIYSKLPKNAFISRSESIEEWLSYIFHSKGVITNSFHATIFSILAHRPFIVVLTNTLKKGMNDRFYTMLHTLQLEERITTDTDLNPSMLEKPIDWKIVDKNIAHYRNNGLSFLYNSIKQYSDVCIQ